MGAGRAGTQYASRPEGTTGPGGIIDIAWKTGAGEGIRTLDPNLGNLIVTLFDFFLFYATAP